MSNMNVSKPSSSLYENIVNSKPAQFAKDNKVITGAALVGSGVILKEVADHSQIAATVIKKGLVPAAGVGATAAGVAMIHNAITTDADRSTGSKILQGAAGAALTLGGIETTGQAFGVSPVGSTVKSILFALPESALIGAAVAVPGVVATAWGVADMKDKGVTLGNAAAVSIGSVQASFYGVVPWLEVMSPGVQKVAEKGAGALTSASLGLGAYALGKEAVTNFKNDNLLKASLYGAGSAAAALTGTHLLAKTVGAPGLEKAAELVMKKPLLTASVVVVGAAAGAYALYKKD